MLASDSLMNGDEPTVAGARISPPDRMISCMLNFSIGTVPARVLTAATPSKESPVSSADAAVSPDRVPAAETAGGRATGAGALAPAACDGPCCWGGPGPNGPPSMAMATESAGNTAGRQLSGAL